MAAERITNYTEARQNLKSLMDSVTEDRVVITRTGTRVVMLSAEYDGRDLPSARSPRTRNACRGHRRRSSCKADLVDGEISERRCRQDPEGIAFSRSTTDYQYWIQTSIGGLRITRLNRGVACAPASRSRR